MSSSRSEGASSGVTFIDILFGFTLTEALMNLAKVTRHQHSVTAGLVVAASVISLSWIGYHNHTHASLHRVSFWSLTFVQFGLDVAIVGLYYLLVRAAVKQETSGGLEKVDLTPETWIMVLIFLAYLFWDAIDCRSERHRLAELWVTAAWLLLMLGFGFVIRHDDHRSAAWIWLSMGLYLALSYGYRVTQERVQQHTDPAAR